MSVILSHNHAFLSVIKVSPSHPNAEVRSSLSGNPNYSKDSCASFKIIFHQGKYLVM